MAEVWGRLSQEVYWLEEPPDRSSEPEMSGKRARALEEWSMKGLLESSGGGELYEGREEYIVDDERKKRWACDGRAQGRMQRSGHSATLLRSGPGGSDDTVHVTRASSRKYASRRVLLRTSPERRHPRSEGCYGMSLQVSGSRVDSHSSIR